MEDHTEHLLYTENDGEIWFERSAVHNVDISSPLYFSVISAVHQVNIVYFFSPRRIPANARASAASLFPRLSSSSCPLVAWKLHLKCSNLRMSPPRF